MTFSVPLVTMGMERMWAFSFSMMRPASYSFLVLYAFSFAVNSGEVLNSEICCRSSIVNSELFFLQKTPLILKYNGVRKYFHGIKLNRHDFFFFSGQDFICFGNKFISQPLNAVFVLLFQIFGSIFFFFDVVVGIFPCIPDAHFCIFSFRFGQF